MWNMKSKLPSTLFKLLLVVSAFFVVERFCHKQTRGFTLPNIYTEQPLTCVPSGLSSQDAETLKTQLAQPFTFLDSGLECYAFISQDRQIVLKFFKHHHIRQAQLLAKLAPFPYLVKLKCEKEERRDKTFSSCRLAYEEMKEETGLIFLHLNKTAENLPTVTIIDKLGLQHRVALDNVQFLIQKRADLLIPSLGDSLKQGDLKSAQTKVSSLLDFITQRCQKGIADRDPTFLKNYGLIENCAIVIDVGSFSKNDFLKRPQTYKRELFYETLALRCLLAKHYPELLPHFDSELKRVFNNE
jgi:hypothetical protein